MFEKNIEKWYNIHNSKERSYLILFKYTNSMLKYALKRIVLIFFTLFIILSITFILMKKVPRPQKMDPNLTKEQWELMEAKYGYDKPVFEQYLIWLKLIVTKWDWGVSTVYRAGVSTWKLMATRFVVNIKINIWATLISVPLGILIGCLIALKKNGFADQFVMVASLIFSSIPSFVIITFMMLGAKYVGLEQQWPKSDEITWKSYIIPVTALAIGPIGGYTRLVRNELSEVLTSDFVLLARTKGLTTAQTISRHAFRNAMVIYIPSIFGEIIGLLGGSLVLERIYGIPGIGDLFLTGINMQDYNIVMTFLAFEVLINLGFGLFADLMYGVVDPRIRVGER